jgi:hypothetical protein
VRIKTCPINLDVKVKLYKDIHSLAYILGTNAQDMILDMAKSHVTEFRKVAMEAGKGDPFK